MRILPSWLREFVDIAADDRQLAEDLTSAGIAVESVGEEHGATIYEMDLTTNRVDAMNHYGVAREASAIYDVELKQVEPKLPDATAGPPLRPPAAPSLRMTTSEVGNAGPSTAAERRASARDDNEFSHRHRRRRGLRAIHGSHHSRREDRPIARAHRQAPGTAGFARHQQRRRRDQLRDQRAGPSYARLRPRPAGGRQRSSCAALARARC